MALSVILTPSISSDVLTATLTDSTVYGGANPARAVLRVFVSGYKVDTKNVATPLVLLSNTGDPATVSSWTNPYTIDGWFRYLYVAVPAYNGATTYAKYDAVYNTSTNAVYRSLTAGNTGNSLADTVNWELIADPSTLALNAGETNDSLNITDLIYNRVFTYASQNTFGDIISNNCGCEDCDDNATITVYNKYGFFLNGAIAADQRSEFIKGESICRKIKSIDISDCGC